MQASTTIQDVAAIATAIGVLFAAFGLRQARYQRQRIFEDSFVQRYWQIMDRLSCAALAAEVTSPLSDSDEHAARSYIRLCEDELELRVYGSIGRKLPTSGVKVFVSRCSAGHLTRYGDRFWTRNENGSSRSSPSRNRLLSRISGRRPEVRGGRACAI
jgi:hypothetical protein